MNHKVQVHDSLTAEGRYRMLVDAISDYAIFMLDPSGIVSSWNPGAERFKGYKADEIIGEHFSRFYTPEDRAIGLPATALHIAATEGRFEREGLRVRKDGSRFWAHVVIDPIRGPSGAIVGFAKITRDLTERRASEQALRESERQLRALVQGVTDYAIYMLDPKGYVTNWNAGAERIKGYTAQEVVGSHFSRFYPEEERNKGTPTRGLEVAAREGRWEQEGLRARKDGSQFWAHVIIDAIRDDDGELIGFAKVTRDVTERRRTQDELEAAREALFQSQKLEAIGQLTGGVAHDFNNLLAAILGSLELVRKRVPEDPRITPLLDNAIQGARRGSTLTQRMLAFARKQDLKLEAVDLPKLVSGMMGFLERSIGPSIWISASFPDNLPKVRTDPSQLENAVLNLVLNARDAMPDGGHVRIEGRAAQSLEGKSTNGSCVCLSIIDTGEGMDEATMARAKEPFFTTKGVGKGTGLGLSMVHGLALQSNGRLDLNSKPGVGTTVEIWLPIADFDPGDEQAEALVSGEKPAIRNALILVVDDDSLVLTNTTALLEDLGHRVLATSSGQAALKLIEQNSQIDLVITDQAMPRMTGLQLLENLRNKNAGLPVIIATGYAELPADLISDKFRLAKPFSQAELRDAVNLALDAATANPNLEATTPI